MTIMDYLLKKSGEVTGGIKTTIPEIGINLMLMQPIFSMIFWAATR